MSALGQQQTCAPQKVMSALPPKADMCGALGHVCFGPKADIADFVFPVLQVRQQALSAGSKYPTKPAANRIAQMIKARSTPRMSCSIPLRGFRQSPQFII